MSTISNRLGLQTLLESILASLNNGGTDEAVEVDGAFDPVTDGFVYFQPPENVKLRYPCIIYKRNSGKTKFANNKPYNHRMSYTVTVVDANPDSKIPAKVAALPMCTHERSFTSNNLNHDVFTLYY